MCWVSPNEGLLFLEALVFPCSLFKFENVVLRAHEGFKGMQQIQPVSKDGNHMEKQMENKWRSYSPP